MRRFGLAILALALVMSVVVLAVGQREDEARAQATKAPLLVMEVASWATGDADPSAWQWQALESGQRAELRNVLAPEGALLVSVNGQAIFAAQ